MPSKKRKYNARFPAGRIKKIMQTDEEVGKVAQAVPVIIYISPTPRTLELFVESLLSKAMQVTMSRNAKTLSPSHVKQCILAESRFDFLRDLVKNIPDVSAAEEKELQMSAESSPNSSRFSDASSAPRRIVREDSNSSSSCDIRVLPRESLPRDLPRESLKRAVSLDVDLKPRIETVTSNSAPVEAAIDLTKKTEEKVVRTANFYQETLVDQVQHRSVITVNPTYNSPQPIAVTPTYNSPQPIAVTPTYNSPQPFSVTPNYNSPQPITVTPTYNSPQPFTVTPTYSSPQPFTVTPTYNSPQPIAVTPTYSSPQPITVTPIYNSPQPIAVNPTYNSPQPSTSSYASMKTVEPQKSEVPKPEIKPLFFVDVRQNNNVALTPPRTPVTPILNIDFSKNLAKPEIKVLEPAVANIVGVKNKLKEKLHRQNSKSHKAETKKEVRPPPLVNIDHLNSGNLQIDEDYDT